VKVLLAVLVIALIAPAAMLGSSVAWKPGTPYYVSEKQASKKLDAPCTGLAQFGRRGKAPVVRFVVFDCIVDAAELGPDRICNFRYRSVKAKRPNRFVMRQIGGYC
jgi:hypothetical protein